VKQFGTTFKGFIPAFHLVGTPSENHVALWACSQPGMSVTTRSMTCSFFLYVTQMTQGTATFWLLNLEIVKNKLILFGGVPGVAFIPL